MDNQDKLNQAWEVTTNSFGFCFWANNIQVIGSGNDNTTVEIDDHIIVTYDDDDNKTQDAVVFPHDLVNAYDTLKSGGIDGYTGTHCNGDDLLDVDAMDVCNAHLLLQVAVFGTVVFD